MQMSRYGNAITSYNSIKQETAKTDGNFDLLTAKSMAAEAPELIEDNVSTQESAESEYTQNEIDFDKIWLLDKEEQELLRQTQQQRDLIQQSRTRNALLENANLREYAQNF